MNVEIQVGRIKRDSRIFIDGVELKRCVLDFDIDLGGSRPTVMLKVFADSMKITAPNVVLIDRHIRDKQGRRELGRQFRYALVGLLRNVRKVGKELRNVWADSRQPEFDRCLDR